MYNNQVVLDFLSAAHSLLSVVLHAAEHADVDQIYTMEVVSWKEQYSQLAFKVAAHCPLWIYIIR